MDQKGKNVAESEEKLDEPQRKENRAYNIFYKYN